jgi:hypothetical protein
VNGGGEALGKPHGRHAVCNYITLCYIMLQMCVITTYLELQVQPCLPSFLTLLCNGWHSIEPYAHHMIPYHVTCYINIL